jgi:ribonuclease E
MPKVMLVNVTHVEESRVAVLEEGILAAYEIETINRTSLKGNIHNAVVESVHPSLEAAFVKIGDDLKGFLPLDEVNFKLLPARSESRKMGKIGQHLRPGQKLMAQVVREPFAGKPPTISTYFSLPGRFMVLMPGVDSSGISRKIEDPTQRERLKKIVEQLRTPEGFGIIARTAGAGQTKVELQRDLRYLLRLWESIQRSSSSTEFPGLVYREADLVIRTIRDHLTSDIGEVWIDSKETLDKALEFAQDVMPNRARILKLYTGDRPLFNKFDLEEQIERIYKRRVPLPSGGEIVIDGTEALTAVDVNSARSKRQADLDDIALQTNLEAASEIARQLSLRDLGGLIVIDFIDMTSTRNKKNVEKAMRDAMRSDKARYDVTVISKLGLMEIARQRIKGAKMAASYATCPVCDGHGLIKNIETSALYALRKLQTSCARGGFGQLRMMVPPEVANWLLNNKRGEIVQTEKRHDIHIEIVPVDSLLRHECRFEMTPREKPAAEPALPPPEAPAAVVDTAPPAVKADPAPPTAESKETGEEQDAGPEPADKGTGRPRRRRKKRRRPGTQPNPPDTAASAVSGDTVPPVPRNIRADELMPAASGSTGGGNAKKKPQSSSSRRRRRSPKQSSSPRRSSDGQQ